jgi:DNA-binding MarR family transcriptional regulator
LVQDAGAQALTHLTLTVFRLNGMLLQWGDALVEPLGLTSARWQVLGAIALSGTPLSAPQVAARMGITRQGAQKQLNLLLDAGLVQAHANPANQRSPLYSLTTRGQHLYDRADSLWNARARQLAASLSEARLNAVNATLEELFQHLAGFEAPGDSSK